MIFFIACGGEDTPLTEEDISLKRIVNYSKIGKIEPSLSDYTILGISGVKEENIILINSSIYGTDSKKVSSKEKIQIFVDSIIAKYKKSLSIIQKYADSNTNTKPKVSDYEDIGIIDMTQDNLVHINRAIDNSSSYVLYSKSKIQEVVNRVNQARLIIDSYADDGNETIPTIEDYEIFGVTGITTDNKKEFDALIEATDSEGVHTTKQMQDLINSII